MTKRKVAIAAAILTVGTSLMVPAAAQQDEPQSEGEQSPGELAREGAQRLMRALEGILQIIPQYGAPRVKENGDIVIPRLNPPEPEDEKSPAPKEDKQGQGDDAGQTRI